MTPGDETGGKQESEVVEQGVLGRGGDPSVPCDAGGVGRGKRTRIWVSGRKGRRLVSSGPTPPIKEYPKRPVSFLID